MSAPDAGRTRARSAYFLFPPEAARGAVTYPHQVIALAEGLRELGWRVLANVPAWRTSEDGGLLFDVASDAPAVVEGKAAGPAADADLLVVDSGWQYGTTGRPLPGWVHAYGRRFRSVGIDGDDVSADQPWYARRPQRHLDVVLRSHGSSAFAYPSNVRPWAFGLSRRIIDAIDGVPVAPPAARRRGLGWNFQHKVYAHTVRKWLERRWLPAIEKETRESLPLDRTIDTVSPVPSAYERLMYDQTCGRHFGGYYPRLKSLAAVACFGGWFLPPVRQPEGGMAFRVGRSAYRKLGRASHTVAQWDSWRFWEALYGGAAVLQLDFEAYGLCLPVMPVAGQHYVGVRPGQNDAEVLSILSDPVRLDAVGTAGREWAAMHYIPRASADRLLRMLGFE